MKARVECIPCILRQILKAACLANASKACQMEILRETMEYLLKVDWNETPIILSLEPYRIVRLKTGVWDPFSQVKHEFNQKALNQYSKLKKIIQDSSDPLRMAIKISAVGNIIDFGPLSREEIEETLNRSLEKKFTIDDYEIFRKRIEKAETILFFADNAGEIVFDKLLLEVLLDEFDIERVTLVVKGGPFINDVTIKDVKQVGLDKIPNLEIKFLSNGDPNSGVYPCSPEAISWIKSHDITISKGQGNFENFSGISSIFFLLVAKCEVVAEELGVQIGDLVFRYNP